MNYLNSLVLFQPEIIWLLASFLIIFFSICFKHTQVLTLYTIAILFSILSFINTNISLYNSNLKIFNNILVLDGFVYFFKLLFLILASGFAVLSFTLKQELKNREVEVYSLILILFSAVTILAQTTEIISFYLCFETISIISYILAGISKNSLKSKEASLKYLIYGGAASAIMIFSISLLYGLTGSFDFNIIASKISHLQGYNKELFFIFLLISFGLLYKIAGVPFHFWAPEVYEGSPLFITTLFATATKIAGFVAIIKFFIAIFFSNVSEWQNYFITICIATMFVGNLLALFQDNIKRLLAYSAIAHSGYIIMALVIPDKTNLSYLLYYLLVYFFMNFGIFLIAGILKRELLTENFQNYKGIGWTTPAIGVYASIFLFSLTGIPPFGGFVAKVLIFLSVIKYNLLWLAILGALNSVISLFYYAKILKVMYFTKQTTPSIKVYSIETITLFLCSVVLILTGVYFNSLIKFINFLLK